MLWSRVESPKNISPNCNYELVLSPTPFGNESSQHHNTEWGYIYFHSFVISIFQANITGTLSTPPYVRWLTYKAVSD